MSLGNGLIINAKSPLEQELMKLFGNFLYMPRNQFLAEVESLLLAGLNPNLVFHKTEFGGGIFLGDANPFITPIAFAIFNNCPRLLLLLLKYKADVTQPAVRKTNVPSLKIDAEDLFLQNLRDKVLPIQLITKKISTQSDAMIEPNLRRLYEILLKETKEKAPLFTETELAIETTFTQLLTLLQRENQIAKSKGKRLMILVGEAHGCSHSLIVETLILLIAKHFLNINTLMVEERKDSVGFSVLNQHILIKLYENKPLNYIEKECPINRYHGIEFRGFTFQQRFNLIPVDLGRSRAKKIGPKYDDYEHVDMFPQWDLTAEGIQYRDGVIATVANEATSDSTCCFLGLTHLYGLMHRTSLKNDFHVVAINATGIEGKEEHLADEALNGIFKQPVAELDYVYGPQIHQAKVNLGHSLPSRIIESFYLPFQAINLSRSIFEANKGWDLGSVFSPLTFLWNYFCPRRAQVKSFESEVPASDKANNQKLKFHRE